MFLIIEAIILSLIFLILLSQNLSIRIFARDGINISIDYLVFSFELSPNKSNEQPKKKSGKRRRTKIFSKANDYILLLEILSEAMRHTSLTIFSFDTYNLVDLQKPPALIGAAILTPIFLSYIRQNAKELKYKNGAIGELDILLEIPLFILFILLLKLAYLKVKKKYQKRKKNA